MRNANLTQSFSFLSPGSPACPYMFLIPGDPREPLGPYAFLPTCRTPRAISHLLCPRGADREQGAQSLISAPKGGQSTGPAKIYPDSLTLWKSPLGLHRPFAVRASAA